MEKSGFFNSSDGDRVYDATDFAAYFGSLVSNGVFYATPTNLLVSPGIITLICITYDLHPELQCITIMVLSILLVL